MYRFSAIFCFLMASLFPARAAEPGPQTRLALVIGEAHYKVAPLATPANDAGLVAEALKEAGFAVTEGADLDGADLRKALHDFVGKAEQAGPNAIIFIYLAGRGMQYAGQNYFVPVDGFVQREADVPLAAVRLSDYFDKIVAAPRRRAHLRSRRRADFAFRDRGLALRQRLRDRDRRGEYASMLSTKRRMSCRRTSQDLMEFTRRRSSKCSAKASAYRRSSSPRGCARTISATASSCPGTKGSLPRRLPFMRGIKRRRRCGPSATSSSLEGLTAAKAYLQAIESDTLEAYADFAQPSRTIR